MAADPCRLDRSACVLGNAFMDTELLKNAGQNLTDPMCRYYHMRVNANCRSSKNIAMCDEMPDCGWDRSDESKFFFQTIQVL